VKEILKMMANETELTWTVYALVNELEALKLLVKRLEEKYNEIDKILKTE
jgi:hypothetical protein